MKKLFLIGLAILSLIAITIQAAPIAQNYVISAPELPLGAFNNLEMSSNLGSLVQGGIQPYTFTAFGQTQNGAVEIQANGDYEFRITGAPASFQFTVTDENGDTSQPATVTLVPIPTMYPEKG